jgi:hypothetical protein
VDGLQGFRLLVHAPMLIYYKVHGAPNCVEILHFGHAKRSPP